MRLRSRSFMTGTILATAIIVLSVTLMPRAEEPADTTQQADEPAAAAPDPFAIADGTPEELLAQIEQLSGLQPQGTTREEVTAFQKKVVGTIGQAADKILAAEPTADQLRKAVNWKLTAIMSRRRLGDEEATAELEAFPARLAKAGHKDLARQIEGFVLNDQLGQAMMAGPEQFKKQLDRIQQFVAEEPIGRAEVALIMGAVRPLSYLKDKELAANAYRDFGKLLSESDNPEAAALGEKMNGAARRMDLVGKPMHLEGTFLDGTPFDWEDYEDKVVLVQFWATWCRPCREEMVNIRRNWDLYHDKGFDVVAVNLDDSREQLEEFLAENELPWKQLFSDDPEASGMDHPMATHYGVMGIPTLILVGPDRKVVSIRARGGQLDEQLEELLGPVEKPAADETAVEG